MEKSAQAEQGNVVSSQRLVDYESVNQEGSPELVRGPCCGDEADTAPMRTQHVESPKPSIGVMLLRCLVWVLTCPLLFALRIILGILLKWLGCSHEIQRRVSLAPHDK